MLGDACALLAAGFELTIYNRTGDKTLPFAALGARIAAFLWTQSWVRDAWQRKILFDLDMTILKLRGQLGDTEEVVGLTGHYHKLLQQWAE